MKNELPMGWQEMKTGFVRQWEVDEGTPEDELETTAHPVKERVCVRFFFRGNTYVRICKILEPQPGMDDEYAIHYGIMNKPADDKAKQWGIADIAKAELQARVLMRIGGY